MIELSLSITCKTKRWGHPELAEYPSPCPTRSSRDDKEEKRKRGKRRRSRGGESTVAAASEEGDMWRRVAASPSPALSSSSTRPFPTLLKALYNLKFYEAFSTETCEMADAVNSFNAKTPLITFVLGGPGTGKGTQCERIAQTFGFTHLSAGDLLRKEMSSKSENGVMICNIIKEGKIVPSEVTVRLLQEAIKSSESNKFLIDGFPRSNENRVAFERIMGVEPQLVLYFDCPEDEMVKRVLGRNQGRLDDNIDTVKKRLEVFADLNLPVINYYTEKGKVHKIYAVGTAEEVFEKVRPLFASCNLC